ADSGRRDGRYDRYRHADARYDPRAGGAARAERRLLPRVTAAAPADASNAGHWRALTLIAYCQVAAIGLWFSATAIVPSLVRDSALSDTMQSLFTSAVQAGFVVGTLTSAILGLADRLDPRRFFAVATLIATIANAAI